MPPEPPAPGSPADWLRRARGDLALALVGETPGVLLEDLCFHCQQATEKAIKAVLVASQVPLPRTHNLKILTELLTPESPGDEALEAAPALTDYAVTYRYPGVYETVTDDEYRHALAIATAVVSWAGARTVQLDRTPHEP